MYVEDIIQNVSIDAYYMAKEAASQELVLHLNRSQEIAVEEAAEALAKERGISPDEAKKLILAELAKESERVPGGKLSGLAALHGAATGAMLSGLTTLMRSSQIESAAREGLTGLAERGKVLSGIGSGLERVMGEPGSLRSKILAGTGVVLGGAALGAGVGTGLGVIENLKRNRLHLEPRE